jgi:hypothetical protein
MRHVFIKVKHDLVMLHISYHKSR